MNMTIYDFNVTDGDGREFSLGEYKGKVLLIINTATGCGFTPQYEEIEAMHEELHDMGLEVLDFPCNQFAGQAPGTDAEIREFCQLHYNTQFPQMKKIEVNGAGTHPLYQFLKSQKGFSGFGEGEKAAHMNELLAKLDPDFRNNAEIKWNFTKFVVDRNGEVIARIEPTTDLAEVKSLIKTLL